MRDEVSLKMASAKVFGSQWAVERFLKDFGSGLSKMSDTAEFDFRDQASAARIELKASRARSNGVFVFQYIRPDCFDVCVCLGVAGHTHKYWVFGVKQIAPFLSHQHRGHDSFQLRLREGRDSKAARYEVSSVDLRERVALVALRSVRHGHVRLHPSLARINGWTAVAKAITRRLNEYGLRQWQVVLRPASTPLDPQDGPEMLPYPDFHEAESRAEFQVVPKEVVGRQNVTAIAWSLADFVCQFVDAKRFGDAAV